MFCGPHGGGNPLGVFIAGTEVPAADRQRVAADLGFSETVFVDDPATGAVRIFTPVVELQFAGHPLVGTAWLLARHGGDLPTLRPPAGEVAVHSHEGLTYVTGRPEWSPGSSSASSSPRPWTRSTGRQEGRAWSTRGRGSTIGREIRIHQGRGSRLVARPTHGGRVEVGGTVEIDEVRSHPA